jgi:hypothetical protein
MGCFNVACGISNLSINAGDPVVFIPLIPPTYRHHGFTNCIIDNITGTNTSNLIYSNCMFDPFCFPIKGTYNDYGGIENIERDINTDVVSDFFSLDIAIIIDIIFETRNINDKSSILHEKFALHNFNDDIDNIFSPDFLIDMGFIQTSKKNHYVFPDKKSKFCIYFDIDEKVCDIITNDRVISCDVFRYNGKELFLNELFELYNYHFNVSYDNQIIVNILSSMAGMFIHRYVYDAMIHADQRFVYNKINVDIFDKQFDEARDKLIASSQKCELDSYGLYDFKNSIFDGAFSNWYFFSKMYVPKIIDGSIKQIIVDYIKFSRIMYSTNHFFFPTMNGEQGGNDIATKVVHDAVDSILKDRLYHCTICGELKMIGEYVVADKYDDYIYYNWICRKCICEQK